MNAHGFGAGRGWSLWGRFRAEWVREWTKIKCIQPGHVIKNLSHSCTFVMHRDQRRRAALVAVCCGGWGA